MISMEASQSFELRQLQDNWRTPVFSICKTQLRDRVSICNVQDAECHPFHCLFRAMEASGKRPHRRHRFFRFFFWLGPLTWTGTMPWAFDGTGGSWQNGTSESLDYDRLYIYIWLIMTLCMILRYFVRDYDAFQCCIEHAFVFGDI